MYHEKGFGLGGGCDPYWEIVAACEDCAAEKMGYEPYPQVLPEGRKPSDPRRVG